MPSGIYLHKKGEEHSNWKGGKPKCKVCGKQLSTYDGKYCSKHRIISEKHKENLKLSQLEKMKKGTWKNQYGGYKGGIKWRDKHSLCNPPYVKWRKEVFTRDNFKCRIDNLDCKGQLEAHHILPWRDYPELRYKINNGITLCQAHHPRKRAEEKRLIPFFQGLVPVSKEPILQELP